LKARQLANRHPVTQRNRIQPDERFEARPWHRPFHGVGGNGIGAVADDDRKAGALRRLQAVRHGVDERVDARVGILEIDHQHVELGQYLGRRLARFALERIDRDLTTGIALVRHLDHVVLPAWCESRAADRRLRLLPGPLVRAERRRIAVQEFTWFIFGAIDDAANAERTTMSRGRDDHD
jgi:hypothetical protein